MAGRTQGHEVLLVVRTAFACNLDVMDKCGRGQYSLSLAQFAQGMFFKEFFPDLPPGSSVVLPCLGTAVIAFIVSCSSLLMFLTIPSVGQSWATRVGTRSLGFVRHGRLSFGHEKSPGGSPELLIGLV